ncbi:hypothetical protein J2TS6_54060 [Paenibacillus albilobatus]|uniref:Copper amine oxidase-like N-terminal domain-containing protein n=1 Tax=Paenibacillus albilobatus TaxID=2716884 RepID=A0A919XPR6_9BACL|nr:copper amine oxidase N-terminal domain-containing protein [Paenibacillus albilobatus]GIO34265.1 hypothetical protein J2TS6_54060 [Paenibacillus albilobatus]
MKKAAITAAIAILLSTTAAAAHADAVKKIIVDGRPVILDQAPVVKQGTTLVPMSSILKSLGIQYSWDPAGKKITASKNGNQIILTVGNKNAYVNGNPVKMIVPPEMIGGRVFVPLRFIGESTGATVSLPDSNTIVITSGSKGASTPPVSANTGKTAANEEAIEDYLYEKHPVLSSSGITLDADYWVSYMEGHEIEVAVTVTDYDQLTNLADAVDKDPNILYKLTKDLSNDIKNRFGFKDQSLIIYFQTISSGYPEDVPDRYVSPLENDEYVIAIPMVLAEYDYSAGSANFYWITNDGSDGEEDYANFLFKTKL